MIFIIFNKKYQTFQKSSIYYSLRETVVPIYRDLEILKFFYISRYNRITNTVTARPICIEILDVFGSLFLLVFLVTLSIRYLSIRKDPYGEVFAPKHIPSLSVLFSRTYFAVTPKAFDVIST